MGLVTVFTEGMGNEEGEQCGVCDDGVVGTWPAMNLQRLGWSTDEDLQLDPPIVSDESEEVVVTRGVAWIQL